MSFNYIFTIFFVFFTGKCSVNKTRIAIIGKNKKVLLFYTHKIHKHSRK